MENLQPFERLVSFRQPIRRFRKKPESKKGERIPVDPIEKIEASVHRQSKQVSDRDIFELLSTLQDEKLRERCSDFEVD